MKAHRFEIEPTLLRRLKKNAKACHVSIEEAIYQSLKDWCENREYLHGPLGRKNFPAVSALLYDQPKKAKL